MTFSPLGDCAVVVTLGASIDEATSMRVRSLTAALAQERDAGIVDLVPAYATVTVVYDPSAGVSGEESAYHRICEVIAACAEKTGRGGPGEAAASLSGGKAVAQVVEIPVCYGGEFGPDLDEVARYCGLKPTQVGELHGGADYVVHAVGFAPGFPYLGGLPEKLRTPRRPTPRLQVPAGSVGIGWAQTGIYPLTSPGGWQLIGRTPLELFKATRTPAALLKVGDRVRFRAITPEEFAAWK